MTSQELRQKFLNFFERNEHMIISSASLVPSEDEQLTGKEKVLFTSAGMQPLIPYLTGQKEPPGKKLADVQKCLRTDDIEEVGDEVHHTFFEMLGNWSIGDYWKDKAIKLSFEFLTKELEIPIEKLAVTVFAGDEDAPKDEESAGVWKELGISEERIFYFGKSHNWWPTGQNSLGPCGPDTEMFYWTGEGESEGKPNEDSRWVEIWNDVFMQFNRKEDRTLEDLPQRNVDTGMGLERTLAVLNGKKSDYETDLFEQIIKEIEKSQNNYSDESKRIIADHVRASAFLIKDGVVPSNKLQGYVLRRLLRRAATKAYLIDKEKSDSKFFRSLIESVIRAYPDYFEEMDTVRIGDEVSLEIRKFRATLERGLQQLDRSIKDKENLGLAVFNLFQSYGYPLELTIELLKERGINFTDFDMAQFEEGKKSHIELSKTASAGMFKGGLADNSETVTKYHTATHLLHQALRNVLGPTVCQKGSNITSERLRFDFSYDKKMTDEEINKVEDLVNEKIREDLVVTKEVMDKDSALQGGALGLFADKYGEKVTVYSIGDPSTSSGPPFSREICGGPHVEHTGVIGEIKIVKEEAVSAGTRRIRAEIMIR